MTQGTFSHTDIPSLLSHCKDKDIPYSLEYDLSHSTSFKTGGLAEVYCSPRSREQIQSLIAKTSEYAIPLTLLGEGSNVLISDTGIKGCVLNLGCLRDLHIEHDYFVVGGGRNVRELCATLAQQGIGSLAYLYGMPGTIGGAVWMNARCYGKEITDTLVEVESINRDGTILHSPFLNQDYSYKQSPFQPEGTLAGNVITAARFSVQRDTPVALWKTMLAHEFDRRKKGHYFAPCAGSIFKNNRHYGEPTGALLDKLGARGMARGDAVVSPFHANIIINRGNARSQDIYHLMLDLKELARTKTSHILEPEIVFLGEWHN